MKLGIKKGNQKKLIGNIPIHYPADRVYLDGDTTKNVQDKVARKSDLTNLDLTGTTNTTGSAIASGTYFYLNGVLVRAKTDIASGATFTLNTNYEVVTDGALNEIIETTVTSGAGSDIFIYLYKYGKIVFMAIGNGYFTTSANATLATLPIGFRPINQVDFKDTYSNKRIRIRTDGTLYCNEALTEAVIRGSATYIAQ